MNYTMLTTKQECLEQLQALGFSGEQDYAEHQRVLAQCAELAKSQVVIEADGPWCLFPRQGK